MDSANIPPPSLHELAQVAGRTDFVGMHVVLRVRPLSPSELGDQGSRRCLAVDSRGTLTLTHSPGGNPYCFSFDQVSASTTCVSRMHGLKGFHALGMHKRTCCPAHEQWCVNSISTCRVSCALP